MNRIVMMAMAGCGIVLPVSAHEATVADAAHAATTAAKADAAPTAAHAENTSLSDSSKQCTMQKNGTKFHLFGMVHCLLYKRH